MHYALIGISNGISTNEAMEKEKGKFSYAGRFENILLGDGLKEARRKCSIIFAIFKEVS